MGIAATGAEEAVDVLITLTIADDEEEDAAEEATGFCIVVSAVAVVAAADAKGPISIAATMRRIASRTSALGYIQSITQHRNNPFPKQ